MENDNKFTAKELRFIEEYVRSLNATQAAIRAGYSKNSARQIASENLSKPHIREKVDELIKASAISAEETKKIISDIATANLSNYLRPVKVEKREKIEKGLQDLIDELKAEMEFEDDFAMMAVLKGKDLERHEKEQEGRRRQMIRYKIELAKNPKAYRIVNGPAVLVDDVELDLAALAADKEGGRIKSLKTGKYGIEVDLADNANMITNMARVHSLFVDKSEVDSKVTITDGYEIGYGDDDDSEEAED